MKQAILLAALINAADFAKAHNPDGYASMYREILR
jgi:hypothetical protein